LHQGFAGCPGTGQLEHPRDVPGYSGEHLALALEDEHIGRADAQLVRILIGAFMNTDQLVGFFKRQRPQQHSFDDGEDGDGAANTYGQGQYGGERKTW